ncbi:MAG: TlpA disulfide reductase family protein [Planctomycetota bacterium]
MLRALALLLPAALLPACSDGPDVEAGLPLDDGDILLSAWLDCPGGDLDFRIALRAGADGYRADLVNGEEIRTCERVEIERTRFTVHIEPYGARLVAELDPSLGPDAFEGEWIRERGGAEPTRLPFHARLGWPPVPDSAPDGAADPLSGRWRVDFSSDESDAVGLFELDGASARGTFLTTLGDYRYLDGTFEDGRLKLSVFDGAHAFLFDAALQEDGSLKGDFWSRDTWHETWTAVRDPEAALPDPFGLTEVVDADALGALDFPDLEGEARRIDDPAFAGKARIVVLFGSWCPNCHDETTYLVELQERFGDAGLSVLGLAFEFGDDLAQQTEQVRRYLAHHGAHYPVLIAGTSDKAKASEAFPVLDRVRAYPTTLFLDGAGAIRAVYTGFSGPATGAEHERLKERFEALVGELLAG